MARFREWRSDSGERLAEQTVVLPSDPDLGSATGVLFTLRRPRSYVLKGQARWLRADCERIVLADVVPEDGQVVLSLHYLHGLQASPNRAVVERDPELLDPIPFIRLRLPEPVTRLTLTWGQR